MTYERKKKMILKAYRDFYDGILTFDAFYQIVRKFVAEQLIDEDDTYTDRFLADVTKEFNTCIRAN